MVPAGAKAGSLVMLRVPEASCIASWSESELGGAAGYAPTSGERPNLGAPDEAFVQAPSAMKEGDTFQMFVRGVPLEVTIPEGAGGGATMRVQLPPAAPAAEESDEESEESEGSGV